MVDTEKIQLTKYSHGAGCGCKISPKVLDEILSSNLAMPDNDKLIVLKKQKLKEKTDELEYEKRRLTEENA